MTLKITKNPKNTPNFYPACLTSNWTIISDRYVNHEVYDKLPIEYGFMGRNYFYKQGDICYEISSDEFIEIARFEKELAKYLFDEFTLEQAVGIIMV